MLIRLRKFIPLLLAVALLWYVLKDISFADLLIQFGHARYGPLIMAGLLLVGYHLLRAMRWQLMLSAGGYRVGLLYATVAILTGLLTSMVVPGAGELARCATLKRTNDVPIPQGLGSVVAERVFDLLALVVLVGITFLLEFDRLNQFVVGVFNLSATANRLGILGLLAVIGLGSLGFGWWLLQRPALRRYPFVQKIIGVLHGLANGLINIRQLKNPVWFIALTILIQVAGWLTVYCLLLALLQTASLPPMAALLVLTASSVGGLAVPTQGGIGTYHFMVSRVLLLYGLALPDGVIAATFQHAVMFGVNLLLSAISVLVVPMLLSQKAGKVESQKSDSRNRQ
jgi:glycosyltransferase 2 family protein